MATSIASMNAALCKKLKESSDIGYHVDDLSKSLNFATKKEVQTRLYDLQNKGEVQRLPGNKWRLTPSSLTAVVETTTPSVTDAPAAPAAPKAIPLNTHPAIKLPGIQGWSSYKNSLQEYCQKLRHGVPVYKSAKLSGGFICTVSFGSTVVKGSQARGNAKESEQQVAFEALIALEYLPKESTYQEAAKIVPGTIGTKRKEPPTAMEVSGPPHKQVSISGDSDSQFKSKLNELAQKNKLPAPTYETVSTPNGFFSTVTFNGRQFKSTKCINKKKDSQQNAAHMALYVLQQITVPPADYNEHMAETPAGEAIVSMIMEARATTGPAVTTPSIPATANSSKNRLQEYVQRMKITDLPKYLTDVRADKSVISTVTVAGDSYTGDVATSKKLAEQSAAMKALVTLGLAAPKAENGTHMQVEA